MKLLLRICSLAVLALCLAGCAARVIHPSPEIPVRRITSATLIWSDGGKVPLRIRRTISRHSIRSINSAELSKSRSQADNFLQELRKSMFDSIGQALKTTGVPSGDDAIIRIAVQELTNDQGRSGALINVSVIFKDAPPEQAVWYVLINAGEISEGASQNAASRIARTAVKELVRSGIIAKPNPK